MLGPSTSASLIEVGQGNQTPSIHHHYSGLRSAPSPCEDPHSKDKREMADDEKSTTSEKAFMPPFRYKYSPMFLSMMKWYCETFSKIGEDKEETKRKILDFGCGISALFIGAAVAAGLNIEATMSDFHPQKRKELEKWLNKEDYAFDFKELWDYLDEISKRGSGVEELTRKSIVRIDSHGFWDDLSHDDNKYDILVTSYCLENAATCQEEYNIYLKKMSNLISEGGHLIIGAVLGSTKYQTRNDMLPQLNLSFDFIKKSITALGLEILDFKSVGKVGLKECADFENIGCFWAKKPSTF